jgi:hypothetical protein
VTISDARDSILGSAGGRLLLRRAIFCGGGVRGRATADGDAVGAHGQADGPDDGAGDPLRPSLSFLLSLIILIFPMIPMILRLLINIIMLRAHVSGCCGSALPMAEMRSLLPSHILIITLLCF